MAEILDVGCGQSKTPGAYGIDILPGPGVDLVHDLNKLPWPLDENRFDEVVCSHVLEHLLDLVGVMNEIHRVAKHGAKIKLITPHFSSLNSWEDPTHTRHFARRSFSFFDTDSKHCYTDRQMKTLDVKLTFGSGLWDGMGKICYGCCPDLWEKHFCFIWRARNLFIELQVIKK